MRINRVEFNLINIMFFFFFLEEEDCLALIKQNWLSKPEIQKKLTVEYSLSTQQSQRYLKHIKQDYEQPYYIFSQYENNVID